MTEKIKEVVEKHSETYMGGFKAIPSDRYERLINELTTLFIKKCSR